MLWLKGGQGIPSAFGQQSPFLWQSLIGLVEHPWRTLIFSSCFVLQQRKLKPKRWKCLVRGDKANWIVLTPHSFLCGCYSGMKFLSRENWEVFPSPSRSVGAGGGWWQDSQVWVHWAIWGQYLKQAWVTASVLEVIPCGIVLKARREETRESACWSLGWEEVYNRVGIMREERDVN